MPLFDVLISFAALTNNFGTIDCFFGITDLLGMSIICLNDK